MNELIESIFTNFTVDGVSVPVKYLYYEGHGEPYVTYQQVYGENPFCGDDQLIGYVDVYDFDVYSKGNYKNIANKIKELLTQNHFMWQPSESGPDQYEPDTKYYHKTLTFSYIREEN